MGVTAEDMQGVCTLEGVPVFALPVEGKAAHLLANIETLHTEPKMQGRQFDVICSWVTFCWLSDPIGSMEMVYNRFLKPGGIMVLANMSMQCDPDPEVSLL